jgi:two-component system response regulator FixJ
MAEPIVHIIDDDEAMRDSLSFLLESTDVCVRTYESGIAFLNAITTADAGCIVTDVRMPEMSGLDLLRRLRERGIGLPVIVMTGHADVPLAVEAMKAGALEFLEKPFEEAVLLRAIQVALGGGSSDSDPTEMKRLQAIFGGLSPRERQVLDGVVAGKLNKVIAFELGISPRTVEVYRANMMSKTGARGLSELVQMVMHARL